ncbi:hypothetical protein GUITHDRAFT_114902 [Guillardia theta CCMP2712]|uniref:Uncharacterized protein n=1 Tax=Guillardia theta (strain CCMP2712) TaxID=905079 RepID=L1ISZ6_GUITC|nr:hypothetical protein GUITHDRAFT_114902 [Guillardia theta CCMP2712]EKX39024.1 hypothetical protein GUITHDRAFT_114902 [Guillardia theta CCMP2712]|eukprot:XP_005826004.1 hypothetical protein GUITHDRAFT_114902 [Guillardia theta CCMP2712]
MAELPTSGLRKARSKLSSTSPATSETEQWDVEMFAGQPTPRSARGNAQSTAVAKGKRSSRSTTPRVSDAEATPPPSDIWEHIVEQTKISLSPRTKLRSNPNSAQPTPRNGNPTKPNQTADFSAVATLCHSTATAEVKPDKYVTALKHKITELEQKDADKEARISVLESLVIVLARGKGLKLQYVGADEKLGLQEFHLDMKSILPQRVKKTPMHVDNDLSESSEAISHSLVRFHSLSVPAMTGPKEESIMHVMPKKTGSDQDFESDEDDGEEPKGMIRTSKIQRELEDGRRAEEEDDEDLTMWIQNSENAYGAFIHLAFQEGLFNAIVKAGPEEEEEEEKGEEENDLHAYQMILLAFFVQAAFAWYLWQSCPSVRDSLFCNVPIPLQLAAIGVYLTLMTQAINRLKTAMLVCLFSVEKRREEGEDDIIYPIHISSITRSAVFLLAVTTNAITWLALTAVGCHFILTQNDVQMVLRSTVVMMFVQNVDEIS